MYVKITFVVVSTVVTVLLEQDAAVTPVPAVGAATLPQTVCVDAALAVSRARVGTALLRAVLPVPSCHTQARPVLALPVFITPDHKSISYVKSI